jgi:hypothetical protein
MGKILYFKNLGCATRHFWDHASRKSQFPLKHPISSEAKAPFLPFNDSNAIAGRFPSTACK